MKERFRLSVSVFVIVLDEGRVLLLRRARTGWQDGCYSLPAGSVDGDEPLDLAAARARRDGPPCRAGGSTARTLTSLPPGRSRRRVARGLFQCGEVGRRPGADRGR